MLSFGIELALAFSIAFWSARFPAGSGPPSFAATMIARVSFEKSLPRFASAAPFLCLIDDHLLCPDTALLPHDVQEALVDARVVGQLRVEGCDEELSLARQHRMAVDLRQYLDVRPRVLEPRRADEDGPQRLVAVPDVQVRLEALHLPAERVAPSPVAAHPEVVAVEDDHARARPEDRAAELAHRLVEAVEAHQTGDRGRLAAGNDEAVEPLELLRKPHLDRLGAEPPQYGGVFPEVPLNGEDADLERLLHRLDGNERYSGSGAGVAVRCRPRRPSSTSQKPSSPKATAGAHGLTCRGGEPEKAAPTMSVGEPMR